MRSTDIHIEWNDSRDRTENMYLPSQVPVEEMSLSEARRGLCARAMGSTAACRSGCGAGCRFGRRVMELEDAGLHGGYAGLMARPARRWMRPSRRKR